MKLYLMSVLLRYYYYSSGLVSLERLVEKLDNIGKQLLIHCEGNQKP